jgi:hypothetical protein
MPNLVYAGWFAAPNGSDIAAAARPLEKVRGGPTGIVGGKIETALPPLRAVVASQHRESRAQACRHCQGQSHFYGPPRNLWARAVEIATVIRKPMPRLSRTR